MFILLLAAALPLRGTEHPARIFLGDAKHPVVSGEAWLIANRWGAYPAVLVGTIREGKFEQRKNIELPQYWEQAFDYKLLLAVSDRQVEAPSSFATDNAYSFNFAYGADPWPEYLKQYNTIYLSRPIPRDNLGKDWETALEGLGHLTGDELLLPRPSQRTIRFLYPDGKPLAGTGVSVSLYGSSYNHCGVDEGIILGKFVTNADGEIHVIATDSPLEFGLPYFKEVAGGPTGTRIVYGDDPIVSNEQRITVKRLWTLPEHNYVLNLRTVENQPIAHAHLEGCWLDPPGCMMPSCEPLGYLEGGPVQPPESDGAGAIRFRHRDLRLLESINVIDAHGDKRSLTKSEMRELLTTYHLNLVW
ncbi:MAG: hypothetical protein WBQ76_02970 [Candidatus Korobacteraceae bacterium]